MTFFHVIARLRHWLHMSGPLKELLPTIIIRFKTCDEMYRVGTTIARELDPMIPDAPLCLVHGTMRLLGFNIKLECEEDEQRETT